MRFSSTVILQRNSDLLLIKRACEPFKGYWALVGGAKRRIENYSDCGIREVKEEVGIFLRGLKHVDVIIVINELGEQVSQVFLAKITDNDLKDIRVGEEVLEAKLFSIAKLPEPIVPFHKETIERYFLQHA